MIKNYEDYKSQFEEFKVDFEKVYAEVEFIGRVQKMLDTNQVTYDINKFREVKQDALDRLSALYSRRDQLARELKELRENCDHNYECTCHTYRDFYRCSKCGHEYFN